MGYWRQGAGLKHGRGLPFLADGLRKLRLVEHTKPQVGTSPSCVAGSSQLCLSPFRLALVIDFSPQELVHVSGD
jgi:hypothetical protein